MSPIGIFRGPFIGERPDRGTVRPGDEMDVSDADLQSGHWDAKDQPQLAAQTQSFSPGASVVPPAAAVADPEPDGDAA